MRSQESFSLAIKNIRAAKLRSVLTMLGIIIGVSAVFVIAGLGNGMKGFMKSSFSDLGTNTIQVSLYGEGQTTKSPSIDDMYALAAQHKDKITAISPNISVSGKLKIGTQTVKTTQISGVSEDFMKIKGMKLAAGDKIYYMDVKGRKSVCVIGSYLAQQYFAGNAIGQELFIEGIPFRVVGVLSQRGASKPAARSGDDVVLIPYSSSVRIGEPRPVNEFLLMANPNQPPEECRRLVENKLREISGNPESYYVGSMGEMIKQMNVMIGVVQAVLTLIAAISLVVGGIGIMNIMLVSVTERTREIGIRKALGAKESYIMQQFVMESAVTSGLGGVMGILAGAILSGAATFFIKTFLQKNIVIAPSLGAVLLSFGISVFIGILFGYLPAKRAAQLSPIDALQYN